MNAILFMLDETGEARVAEFLESPKHHVHVKVGPGLKHEAGTTHFDSIVLDIGQLMVMGVKRLRLEVQSNPLEKK